MKFPLLVKFPSRSRPQLFASTFARWNAAPEAVRFVVSLDADDVSLPAYLEFLADKPNVRVAVGTSPNKVHAINRDLEGEEFSVLVCAADDMIPQRADYAAEIMRLMRLHFPDGDGVLHLNDGRRTDGLNTIPIMGRRYFDRFGWIYNPVYSSTHCDDEFTAVSRKIGRVVRIEEVLVRHDWVGDHHPDDLHRRNESYFSCDAKTFEQRKENSFGFPRQQAGLI